MKKIQLTKDNFVDLLENMRDQDYSISESFYNHGDNRMGRTFEIQADELYSVILMLKDEEHFREMYDIIMKEVLI